MSVCAQESLFPDVAPRCQHPNSAKPHHILGRGGARWTLCGIKVADDKALPYFSIRYLELRQQQGTPICAECDQEVDNAR